MRVLAILFMSPALASFLVAAGLEAACTGGAIYALTRVPGAWPHASAGAAWAAFFSFTAGRFACRGWAEMALSRAQAVGIARLMMRAADRNTARPDIRGDARARDRFAAGLPSTGVDIATGLTHFLDRLARVALTTVVMLTLYTSLLGPGVLLANLVGVGCAIAMSTLLARRQQRASGRYETRRMQLAALPGAGWDTITIGNRANLVRWSASLRRKSRNYTHAQRRLAWTTVSSQWLIVTASHIPPVLALLDVVAQMPASGAIELAVALPGFLLLLGAQAEFSALCASAGVLRTQVNVLSSLLAEPEAINLLQRVDFSRVRFHQAGRTFVAGNLAELLSALPVAGAVTVSGDNASGKTSLLLYLKSHWGASAFYLPANHSLLAHKALAMSTGEGVVDQVAAAVADDGVAVLLMDEWQANLDDANRRNVGSLLARAAAKGRLVIEALPSRC
jgi:hypothetical protein